MRDLPVVVLARHFFWSLFDFGFLSEDGAESLKKALLGSLAVALALGFFLTRMFMTKYAELSAGAPDAYERAVLADHAFLIAVPMWFVAAAIGFVGHSLFPDQTDFRILMAEPLSRSTIFAAKLASLLLFAGLFVAGAHLAILPMAGLTLIGAARTGSVVAVAAAFLSSSLVASLFAALAIVAVHGLLVLFAPRARLLVLSGLARSVLVGGLLLSLPLVARLPASAGAFASNAPWLYWTPPAWFVGLERWLIGDENRAWLAATAALATAVVCVISIGSYVLLYRRFDRVVLQPSSSQSIDAGDQSLASWNGRAQVRHAIGRFVSITIRRSVLHQGLVVGALAAAGGFVLNSLISAEVWREPLTAGARHGVMLTLLWAPMTMIFLAAPALRLALSIPLELRSNWIFRMTEDVAGRAEVVAATVRTIVTLAVAVPLGLLAPLQWWVLGPRALGAVLLQALIGWLLVEWHLRDWRRIPFTCSYIPGKGFVPYMFVKGVASFVFFTFATGIALRLTLGRPRPTLVLAVLLGAAATAMCVRRMRQAPLIELTFEDELPTELTPLRLNAD